MGVGETGNGEFVLFCLGMGETPAKNSGKFKRRKIAANLNDEMGETRDSG